VTDLKAERVPGDSTAYEQSVRIGGHGVTISASDDSRFVVVRTERGSLDTTIVPTIARRFDAVLATGVHDARFLTARP
jgi:hypothetical protein